MPQHKSGSHDEREAKKDIQTPSREIVGNPITSLEKGGEPPKVQSARVQSARDYYQSPPEQRFWRFVWKYSQVILSGLTFAILIFYALLWIQGYENRRLEYRAYVSIKGMLFLANKDNPAWGDVYVVTSNSGRTLGREGKIRQVVEHREGPPRDDTIINEPTQASSKVLYVPGVDLQHHLGGIGTQVADTLANPPSPSVQGKPGATPTVTPVIPSLKLPEAYTKGFGPGFYIYGVIDYKDIFDVPHWTKFCFYIAPGSSNPSQCPSFNDADTN